MIPLRRCSRLRCWLFAAALTAAGALSAQTTLYVTVGPYFYSYNAQTGAPIATPLGNAGTYTGQAALDGNGKLYIALWGQNNVGVYDATTGTALDQTLISAGYYSPTALALWGGSLYVASQPNGVVSRVDPATGAVLATNFISGLSLPSYMVIDSSGRLFVSEHSGSVSLWNASTGVAINRNFISGLGDIPTGLALDDAGRLFVAIPAQNKVAVFDATTGAVINPNLIANIMSPQALATDTGGALYVGSYNGTGGYYEVGRYDATTGAALNAHLLNNGGYITSLNVFAVPEPATGVCLALGLVWLGCRFGWRRFT